MQRETYAARAMALAEAIGCEPDCLQPLLQVVDCALGIYRDGECLDFDALAAAIGTYVLPANVCRVATGTYTGDGTLGQAIVGVGFRPRMVWIFEHPAGGASEYHYVKLDKGWGDFAIADHGTTSVTDRVNSLDADGFTVDDGGGNFDPNANGVVYDYLALGTD